MKPASRLAPVALVAALVLSGCGGGDDGDAADNPSSDGGSSTSTSAGGTSTTTDGGEDTPQPGDELKLGESAPLSWKPKENLQGDVDVTVQRIDQSTMKDFAAFRLEKDVRASTPYYVHVKVKNTGDTNLSGVEVPIYLDNGSDVLFPAARIRSSFKPCANDPLPEKFTPGKKANLCLVFLAAKNTKLEAIAMRPTEQTDPITWTGKITKPAAAKKDQKKG
ncbi:MAG: hypothetical protein ABWX84_06745 [Nocardioides sp.]